MRSEQWDRAVSEYEGIIEAKLAVWGSRAEETLGSRVNYASCLKRSGRIAEGEAELRDVLQVCVESLGDDHIVAAACRNALRK